VGDRGRNPSSADGGIGRSRLLFLDFTAIAPHRPIPSRLQPLPNLVAQCNSPLPVGIELQGLIEGIERTEVRSQLVAAFRDPKAMMCKVDYKRILRSNQVDRVTGALLEM